MKSIQQDALDRLKIKTASCRDDMHEPDEQGISAVVSGYHLDNSMGDIPHDNFGEFTVGISDNGGKSYQWFNLATLIALARKAEL